MVNLCSSSCFGRNYLQTPSSLYDPGIMSSNSSDNSPGKSASKSKNSSTFKKDKTVSEKTMTNGHSSEKCDNHAGTKTPVDQLKSVDSGNSVLLISIGLAIGLAIGIGGFNVVLNAPDDPPKVADYSSEFGVYENAAVASDSKICSDVGRDIMLIHGGNAVDSAIATTLCSGTLYSHSTGLGGGGFFLLYLKKHGWLSINARETAPLAASRDMFQEPQERHAAREGPKSICVPGLLKGVYEMHMKFGSVPWKTIVTPTIELLQNGFPLTVQSYKALARLISVDNEKMVGFEMFLDSNNHVKQVGSLITMPKLARTFRIIADDPMSFYNGSLAKDILLDIQETGGVIQQEDLDAYKIQFQTPVKFDLDDDKTLYSSPSPGGGPVLIYIMSILKGYNLTTKDVATTEGKILTYHRITEAFKFAYSRKTELGDGDFVDIKELVKKLTSSAYGEQTRSMISDDGVHDFFYYGPKYYSPKEHGTSHSSVLDAEGNAVSITTSLNMYFGSRVIGNRTGIMFNDQMNDFSHPYLRNYYGLQSAEANFIAPGKRPLSAMAPVIVWDNKERRVDLVIGAAGGVKIPTALTQSLLDLYAFNESVPQSLDKPRLYHELMPNNVLVEGSFPKEVKEGLVAKGHYLLDPYGITVVQMIKRRKDSIVAGSDYRKGGVPSGY